MSQFSIVLHNHNQQCSVNCVNKRVFLVPSTYQDLWRFVHDLDTMFQTWSTCIIVARRKPWTCNVVVIMLVLLVWQWTWTIRIFWFISISLYFWLTYGIIVQIERNYYLEYSMIMWLILQDGLPTSYSVFYMNSQTLSRVSLSSSHHVSISYFIVSISYLIVFVSSYLYVSVPWTCSSSFLYLVKVNLGLIYELAIILLN